MTKQLIVRALATTLLLGCMTGCGAESVMPTPPVREPFTVELAMVGAPSRLDPIYVTDSTAQSMVLHLYQPLMQIATDEQGLTQVVNGLAKGVDKEIDLDGTATYTFSLRQAKWSDGKPVTAHDFVYAWKRLVNPASFSPNAELLSMVKGYAEVQSSGDTDAFGVTALDETTLQVELVGGYDWFLEEVCTSPATVPLRQDVVQDLKAQADATNAASGEATATWSSDFAALVTCGPYGVTATTDQGVTMETQDTYYEPRFGGPDVLELHFVDDAQEGWEMFQEEAVDFTYPLPEEVLSDTLNGALEPEIDASITTTELLATTTVLVNHHHGLLSNLSMRQALDGGLDRLALAQGVSVGAQVAQGLVPPGIMEDSVRSFRYVGELIDSNPETMTQRQGDAKLALAQVGYDSAQARLTLLYQQGEETKALAQMLCDQWEALGVRVTPVAQEYAVYTQSLLEGNYDLALSQVVPTAKDAEFYLTPFTTDNGQNVLRYENSAYDMLLEIAFSAEDHGGRMGCLHDAEELLLADCALLPLYTRTQAWALNDELVGVLHDGRGWFTFSTVEKE